MTAAAVPSLRPSTRPRRLVGALAAGAAGLALVAVPKRADASYGIGTAPDGGDLVNTNLTVQGNLAIGGATSAPFDESSNGPILTVYRATADGSEAYVAVGADRGSDASGLGIGGYRFVWNRNTTGHKRLACLLGFTDGSTAGQRGGALGFLTKPDGAPSLSERLRIDSKGSVGIGTSSPGNNNERLTVVAASSQTTARFNSNDWIAGSAGNSLQFRTSTGLTSPYADLQVYTNGGNEYGNLVCQPSGGNVGIGTTSPDVRLHLGDGALKIGTRVVADSGGSYYAP